MGPCLGTHTQKGLRNTNALCGAQVPRIGPSHGLYGFLSRQAQSHLPLRHREFGLAHAAQLRIAAPQQRPAHTKLNVEALVVAAEGIGHCLARVVHACAAKQLGTAARLALLCHVLTEPFSSVVSRDTMARAIDMVRSYVIPALRYCLAELGGVEIMEQWIQQWLLYHIDNRQTVTLSEVKRAARRKLEKYTNIWMQDRAVIDAMGTLETARWVVRLDDGTREHLHQAEWAVNPKIKDAFTRQRTEIIVARQRAEDERRRIAKLARRIVPGFDPETMEPLLRAG